ncbi:MAG: SDR family NAD(P)-dependent oxidoreductase [Planctomycetes bacterium]|nr:SDR family NAD(P)-dependent oxidoreductase [Planctomycetota bacterium]
MTPSNPVALITGAGSGIGRATARLLAQEGYAIAAIDRREKGLVSLADELQAQQKPIAWRVADVTDPPGLMQATRELEAKLGPTDLLIASAGIGTETTGLDYSIPEMNLVMNVNLIGVSNSIGAVLPGMVKRQRGHLVAISSVASYRGLPRMLAYCASKAGVNAIMDGLRIELKPIGIHVTTVCPAWVRTPMTEKLDGNLEHLIDVEVAAQEILYAIRKKRAFHAFPRAMRWKLGFMLWWPRSWQDWYIKRMMNRININKDQPPE